MSPTSLFPTTLVSGGIVSGLVSAPLNLGSAVLAALTLGGLAVAILGFLRARLAEPKPATPHLRLIPTANAWGFSERATLDESAVGL